MLLIVAEFFATLKALVGKHGWTGVYVATLQQKSDNYGP